MGINAYSCPGHALLDNLLGHFGTYSAVWDINRTSNLVQVRYKKRLSQEGQGLIQDWTATSLQSYTSFSSLQGLVIRG